MRAGYAVLASCGTPGVPMPPALELARPVTDLRAARKGARVYLAWTVPSKTTDHQTVRHPGTDADMPQSQGGNRRMQDPVAEIPASQFPVPAPKKNEPAPKIQASYTDTFRRRYRWKIPRQTSLTQSRS